MERGLQPVARDGTSGGEGRDLTLLRGTYGITGETGRKGVQRFPAGGYPDRVAGC